MLELIFSDGEVMPGEDVEFATINIVPGQEVSTTSATDDNPGIGQTNGHASLSVQLFEAIGNCQELNPDPPSMADSDEEPAMMPGEGGWITSENMDQFMDADGNFAMPTTSLGQGAGHARTADELDNGNDGEAEDDTKWRRTDHDHTE
ncbi:hypothetical protein MRB53_038753 [Persea americana]|nr:hypothetical protein MRB53_038753 [Persea americana]